MTTDSLPTFRIALLFASWFLVWTLIQFTILLSLDFDWPTALSDAVVSQVLLGFGSYTLVSMLRFYRPDQKNLFNINIWSIALTAILVFAGQWILKTLFEANTTYVNFLSTSLMARAVIAWLLLSLTASSGWIWLYIKEQRELARRSEDAQKLARETELAALRQQLQPHFLFNSLNSISALVATRPEEARKMLQQLSDFLRGTVKTTDVQFVTMEEELEHLRLYLEIERVRFGHRLDIQINTEPQCLPMKLPALLLQPVVENAIKFGLYDTVGAISISLNARADGSMLVINVKNPFDPATSSPKEGTGFGLASVQRRLYLLFSRADLLVTSPVENVFTTTIKIPQP